jgi:hypothetical protein
MSARRRKRKRMETRVADLWTGLTRSIDRHLDGLVVGGYLQRHRRYHNGDGETFPWRRNGREREKIEFNFTPTNHRDVSHPQNGIQLLDTTKTTTTKVLKIEKQEHAEPATENHKKAIISRLNKLIYFRRRILWYSRHLFPLLLVTPGFFSSFILSFLLCKVKEEENDGEEKNSDGVYFLYNILIKFLFIFSSAKKYRRKKKRWWRVAKNNNKLDFPANPCCCCVSELMPYLLEHHQIFYLAYKLKYTAKPIHKKMILCCWRNHRRGFGEWHKDKESCACTRIRIIDWRKWKMMMWEQRSSNRTLRFKVVHVACDVVGLARYGNLAVIIRRSNDPTSLLATKVILDGKLKNKFIDWKKNKQVFWMLLLLGSRSENSIIEHSDILFDCIG